MIISIAVNDYKYVSGIIGVTDQFIINREKFKQYDIEINRVYDKNSYFEEIPARVTTATDKNTLKSKLRARLKNSIIAKSFLGESIIMLKHYLNVGKKVAIVIKKNIVNEEFIISQDVFISYYYLKKKINCNLIHMTHMYDDELKQFFIYYPHLKGTIIEKKIRDIHKYVYENCKAIVTISNKAKEILISRNNNYNVFTNYNAISSSKVLTMPGRHDKINIAIVCSLTSVKGMDFLLEIFESDILELKQSCEFHIYGDGDYYLPILKVINEKNLPNVHLYGYKKNPYLEFGNIDVLLLASRTESLPMCIIEALSVGIPVLATDVGAVNEMVEDTYNGYLVKPTKEAILEGILRIIKNKSNLEKMGKNGRQVFKKKFTSDIWVANFSVLLSELQKK